MDGIRLEDIEKLPPTDRAAIMARKKWLDGARPEQLLPVDDGVWDTVLWRAGRFFGKALDISTPVPTPSGWSTMGGLQAGDTVYDEQGRECRVLVAHSVMLGRKCYRLTFSDGSQIVADEDHLWLTWSKVARKSYRRAVSPSRHPSVVSTADIAATLRTRSGERNHMVEIAKPLQGSDRDLQVGAYTLGYWLGDGTTKHPEITCHADEMPELAHRIATDGYLVSATRKDKRGSKAITMAFGCGGVLEARQAARGTLLGDLRAAGVLGNKHIPIRYLRASEATRRALLAGLMDADGSASKSGYVELCLTNERLATDSFELVVSLGFKPVMAKSVARLRGKDCGSRWRITWTARTPVFRLLRKQSRLDGRPTHREQGGHRSIVSVEPVPSVPVRCITVDSPSSLYLVGKTMIPTHNTRTLVEAAWWEGWRMPKIRIHALAPTIGDVRRTLFEGESGFLERIPSILIKAYDKTNKEITLVNGTVILGFSTVEEAGRLRGPQCHLLIFDEVAQADRPAGNLSEVLTVAFLGVRLICPDGTPARKLLATTPKSIPAMKRLEKRKNVRVIHGSSYANLKNVSVSVRNELLALEGTLMGKQEIGGDYIDEEGDQSIFRRSWFRLWPKDMKLPEFTFILESWDTAESEEQYDAKKQTTDPSACLTLGLFNVAKYFEEKERRRLGVRGKYGVLVLDWWTERLGFPDLLDRARRQRKLRWGSPHPGRKADLALIEQKSTGKSLRQMMAKWGAPTWPYNPGQESKTIRAHAASPYVAQHLIFLPESTRPDRVGMPRDWCEEFLEQICGFTGEGSVEHDEAIDTASQAIRYLADRGMIEATPDEKTIDYEEKRDQEMREAEREYAKEKRQKMGNPYA